MAGKSGGKGLLPPTNPKRANHPTKTHLRDQRTIKRLKMYSSKIKRDDKGNIIKGSVLGAADRVEKQMARIEPDRRWFGNTRVIGQESLQKFRTEMGAKYRDPYSVIIKQSKLPLSLLEVPKGADNHDQLPKAQMQWENTFGDSATRKRVRLNAVSIEDMATQAILKAEGYSEEKDRRLLNHPVAAVEDRSSNQKLFKKGQSNRIWNELYKVVDSSDVVLYVLDARDPMGTRSPFLEEYMKKEKKFKHFVFVLNKCDLIPLWATARWLQILSKDYPTIAFHASVNHPFGKGNLISLLRQFNKLHNVTHRGDRRTKTPISVGIIGYPNVGKSSLINTLRRKSVCKVAPIPGETKVWQYVALTRSIFLIDCPGIVYDREGNNDVQAVLKGIVRVERLGSADKTQVVDTVLQIVKKKDLIATYDIREWVDVNDFLEQLAKTRGKLLPGGVPDSDSVARSVLYDWQRGKLPWFNAPPFESNQLFREAVDTPAARHMKYIEHYHTFNIVDDRLEAGGDLADVTCSESDEEELNCDEEEEELNCDEEQEEIKHESSNRQNVKKPIKSDARKSQVQGAKKQRKKTVDKNGVEVSGDNGPQSKKESLRIAKQKHMSVSQFIEDEDREQKKRTKAENKKSARKTQTAVKMAIQHANTEEDSLWAQFMVSAQ
eukprot:Tbor_TRINITY_DN2645_c0_g2::TRINITY_DN2645_c0_g2_i1::g.17887::m.17887/K14537/NUG2, GNL2; nuclear GTP-binding protein